MSKDSQIVIYQDKDSGITIDVKLEGETIWLDQYQLEALFDTDRTSISRHLKNIYSSDELDKEATSAKIAQVQQEGEREVKRTINVYNLDAILSVGYRVNSKKGTAFRKWANAILKDYLVKGYALNEKRLEQKEQEVKLLKDGIHILTRTVSKAIEDKASDNIILETFAKGLSLLDDYDHEELDAKGLTTTEANYPSLDDYQEIINKMLTEFDSDVFGKEKDKSFQSSVAQIAKGFGDDDFYPSIEEKATMLLYFVVKNHSFVDGNKRIAAACFLKFLQQNNMLFNNQQEPIISNDTLASLTLFIASSKPDEMQTVTRLVISVLNRNKIN
ncbi:death-on-curing protein [Algibacter amylolyticus]|uniref:Death-on-curing protein n=1 Tax=Algibacter amylolyticus TaxID=1608400 RepID=A0A5M7BA09_9FLAO|nr:virulence protein RhuM/Fic/DOC family protein [Algibacter amylolyticus]KAA5826259.1 death-on-curing protein [Algibacter amylolyticus]MBB5268462.1 prophage maintenance system killer protein [Algibacter amylolyticus]TSJ80297.1 death-on-curing protein [Algibacter amylolyticus]